MTPQLIWTLEFVFVASMVILATAVFFHVRRVSKKLADLNIEEAKRRIAELEQKVDKTDHDLSILEKEEAETKIKTRALEGELKEVKETSNRYLGLFKTVIYGFDYIVQGCKNALEIEGPGQQPEEKQLTSDEKERETDVSV